jgi:DNA-binding beta-propeller fold protein YncE
MGDGHRPSHHNLMKNHARFSALILAGLLPAAFDSSPGVAAELKFKSVPNHFEEVAGRNLGPCHGGAVIDQAGNVYVTTDTPRGIDVFSSAGKYVRSFGPTRIHALELRAEEGVEYLYIARPSAHEVSKIRLDGEQVWTLTYPVESGLYKDAKGFNPCAVTVGPDGSIFVADGYGADYVLKFDRNRKFVKSFGGRGKEEGKFNTCHGIGLDTRQDKPLLFVCNRNNDRVEHWDLEGNFVRVIQKDLRMPAAVHIRGDHALVPELKGRVTLLHKDGTIAAQLGDNPNEKQRANFGLPRDQWSEGVCNSPHGGSIDKDGSLIISEWSQFGRLHKFQRQP